MINTKRKYSWPTPQWTFLQQQKLSKKLQESAPLLLQLMDIPDQVMNIILPRLTINETVQMRPVSHRWNNIVLKHLETRLSENFSLTVIVQNKNITLSSTNTLSKFEKYMNGRFLLDDYEKTFNFVKLTPEIIGETICVKFSKINYFTQLIKNTLGKNVQKLIVFVVNSDSTSTHIIASYQVAALINVCKCLKRLSIWMDNKSIIVESQFSLFCKAISNQTELVHLDLNYFAPIYQSVVGIHSMLGSTVSRLHRLTIGCVFKQISEILPAISPERLKHLSLMLDKSQFRNWLTDGQHWNIFDKVSQVKVLHLNIVNIDVRTTRYCSFLKHFPNLKVFRFKVQCQGNREIHSMNGHFFRSLCQDICDNAPKLTQLTLMDFAISCVYHPNELAMINLRQVSICLQPHHNFFQHICSILGTDLPDVESIALGITAQNMVALFPNAKEFIFVGHTHQALNTQLQFSNQLYYQAKRAGRSKPSVQCYFSEFDLIK